MTGDRDTRKGAESGTGRLPPLRRPPPFGSEPPIRRPTPEEVDRRGDEIFKQSIAELSRRLGERAAQEAADPRLAAERRRAALLADRIARKRRLKIAASAAGLGLAAAAVAWLVVSISLPSAPEQTASAAPSPAATPPPASPPAVETASTAPAQTAAPAPTIAPAMPSTTQARMPTRAAATADPPATPLPAPPTAVAAQSPSAATIQPGQPAPPSFTSSSPAPGATPSRVEADAAATNSAPATPDRATPDQATPDQATPDQATPDQATPDRATPDQATPDQASNVPAPPAVDQPPLKRAEIQEVQTKLYTFGFKPGPIDGAAGPMTQAAAKTYQADRGLPQTGAVDRLLLEQLRQDPAPQVAQAPPPVPARRYAARYAQRGSDPFAPIRLAGERLSRFLESLTR